MPPGITIEDVRIGDGPPVEKGHTVVLHYDGYLNRGDKFRSSRDDGAPIEFIVGRRTVIAGLEQGVIGMRVGGQRRIVVSPHQAYREAGIEGVVPPNAVLRFEIELLEIR
jgi:FKBP-type peptidyl-prolyl cis-trans isomerase